MSEKINEIRSNTLNLIERNERNYNFSFGAAAFVELLFFVAFLLLADFSNRVHILLLIMTIVIYTIMAFGLLALGLHVNRNTLRVLNAIELLEKDDK
ncbi:MAG: hypothetical protein H0X15_03020 [Acidobacteria bacterium]|jgi:hypothetical protein|nr:hypothetical protein [Acidobacteriota bacterium]MBA3784500.1 hypothetical protein [Acidobacteriota bacterium]MBA4123400.1 hypothetical protein [Acidobacteriota bacterium]